MSEPTGAKLRVQRIGFSTARAEQPCDVCDETIEGSWTSLELRVPHKYEPGAPRLLFRVCEPCLAYAVSGDAEAVAAAFARVERAPRRRRRRKEPPP